MSPSPAARSRLRLLAAAALPALFVFWLYAPSWHGGLLSDDLLLMGYVVEPGSDPPRVNWQRAADDFSGPWAFGFGSYYRPLVTLTLCVDWWLGNGAEWVFHATSIAMFALCAGSWALLFGLLWGPLAALAGGLWFAAHPAAHEPICWPCTRADFMVLIAAAWACIGFVRHLQGRPGRNLLWTGVAVLVALLCKESALLLAAWFVMLDFGVRRVPLRQRLLTHARFLPLWTCYLVWRAVVLDAPFPTANVGATWIDMQLSKLRACAVPLAGSLPQWAVLAIGVLVAWVFAGGLLWRQSRRWIALAVPWTLLAMLPAQWFMVYPGLSVSRVVLASLTGMALAVAAVLGGQAIPRWFRCIGVVLLLLAVAALAMGARAVQARYAVAWQEMSVLRRQIDEAGSKAVVSKPLVLLAGVRDEAETPFLAPAMTSAIVSRPLTSRDHPFVSLGLALQPGIGPQMLERDAGCWRAMWQQGAVLCYWATRYTGTQLTVVPRQGAPIALVRTADRFALAGGAASPWPIGRIEVLADATFAGGELTWITGDGATGKQPIGPAQPGPEGYTAIADLAEDFEFLLFGSLCGVTGFQIALSGDTVARELRVLEPLPPAPLPDPLCGRSIALDDLARELPWAALPTGRDPGTARAVLITQVGGFQARRHDDGRVTVPAPARALLRELERFFRTDRVYYYLECRLHGRPWRSAIDWFMRLRA